MIRTCVVASVLFLALSWTIERRAVEACTSSCGDSFMATDCTCPLGSNSCRDNSFLWIDAVYNNVSTCKARIVAGWSCTAVAARLTKVAHGGAVSIG